MNILIVNRSIAHFSYYESLYYELYNRGHSLYFIFGRGKGEDGINKSFCLFFDINKDCQYEWMVSRQDEHRQKIIFTRELLSYSSYLNRKNQSSFYLKRWFRYQPKSLQLLIKIFPFVNIFLKSNLLQEQLRKVENETPPDEKILEIVESKNPDLLITAPINMRFSEEIEYLKAARYLNIPAILPVISWDNLTTKGLIHLIPTYLLVWSEQQLIEAKGIHKIPEKNIKIIGSLFFDKWFDKQSLEMNRSQFLESLNFNENDEYVLYLGSSANIAEDETWLIREMLSAIINDNNPNINKLKIIIRPHPANVKIYRDLDHDKIIILPKDGVLPESSEAKKEFYNSVKHSVATIGINTSAMIDALIIGKPCVSILTDKYRSTQVDAMHFKYLQASGALNIVESVSGCISSIVEIHNGIDNTKTGREFFVKEYIRPHGVNNKVGEIAASFIENEFCKVC